MLAIRFQRVGRKGRAEFRVVVQESRRTPSSGNIVAQIGHYNPHTKATVLDKEKAAYYVGNGAQPSPRVTVLLQKEGVKLPSWVNLENGKSHAIKNNDKLRRNRPAEQVVAKEEPATAEPVLEESVKTEQEPESTAEATQTEEVVSEEPVATEPAAEAEATEK